MASERLCVTNSVAYQPLHGLNGIIKADEHPTYTLEPCKAHLLSPGNERLTWRLTTWRYNTRPPPCNYLINTSLSAIQWTLAFDTSLHFASVVDDAKCILVMQVCLCVCLSLAAFPHYCTDPDVTWGNGSRCPLVVHCWADLQSMHGFRCYDNTAPNAKCSECLYWLYAWFLCSGLPLFCNTGIQWLFEDFSSPMIHIFGDITKNVQV